jgi:Sugar (and other) transporter
VVLCEIFPQFVRSAAMSIAIATLFAWSSIVVFILPYMAANVGLLAVFITYTVTAGLSVVLMYFLVPETRGIDLEISYKLVNIRIDKTTKCCRYETAVSDQSDEFVQPSFDARDNDGGSNLTPSRPTTIQGSYNTI